MGVADRYWGSGDVRVGTASAQCTVPGFRAAVYQGFVAFVV